MTYFRQPDGTPREPSAASPLPVAIHETATATDPEQTRHIELMHELCKHREVLERIADTLEAML